MLRTERFGNRKKQLRVALNKRRMLQLWKKHVRSSLRQQPLSDLHDYYDFQINAQSRIEAVRTLVLEGRYQPSLPIRVRSEKSLGMSRHLVFLTPEDALVLESIADYLFPVIRDKAPTQNAYFSRNRGVPKSEKDVDGSFGYEWWKLWPEFQNRILKFSEKRNYTVVTDVANYYDNIGFCSLRNFLSGLDYFSEIFLDFLFFLFEQFVWRPDYLPYSGRGLPQITLDAPRLVAHAFLYEVDELLQHKSNGDFVRWLDDIDFGCDTKKEAMQTLQAIDELLLSHGLHLNSSKTRILESHEAFEHFQLRENRYLNIFSNRLNRKVESNLSLIEMKNRIRKRFRYFLNSDRKGQWQKIYKRYITIGTRLQSPFLQKHVPSFLEEIPSLREGIFRYYEVLNWSRERQDHILHFLESSLDDIGFSGAIELLINWSVYPTIQYTNLMRELAFSFNQKEPIRFLGGLRLLAKFGSAKNLDQYIRSSVHIWRSDEWLGRQIICLWPRLRLKETKNTIKGVIKAYGLSSAYAVLNNYEHIGLDIKRVKETVSPYILASSRNGKFTLPKVLISLAVLQATESDTKRNEIRLSLLDKHSDPIYRWYIKRGF